MRVFNLFVFSLLLACDFSSFAPLPEPEPPTPEYTISVAARDGAVRVNHNGAASGAGKYRLKQGETLTVSVDPINNYFKLQRWEGADGVDGNTITVTADRDKSITAVFAMDRDKYAFLSPVIRNASISVEENGERLAAKLIGGRKTYLIDKNQFITIAASPEFGFSFIEWQGGLQSMENPLTTRIQADMNLILKLENNLKKLSITPNHGTVAVESGGTVLTPVMDGGRETYFLEKGEYATITATPDAAYLFGEWRGDMRAAANPLITRITDDLDLILLCERDTENFPIPQDRHYRLWPEARRGTISVIENGAALQPEMIDGRETYLVNKTSYVTIEARAAYGYRFLQWHGDMGGSENPLIRKLSGNTHLIMVAEDNNVELAITQNNGFAEVEAGGVVLTPSETDGSRAIYKIQPDDYVTVRAIPDPFYSFSRWRGDEPGAANPYIGRISSDTKMIMLAERDSGSIPPGTYNYLWPEARRGTISVICNGEEIQSEMVEGKETFLIPIGEYATITGEADPGHKFLEWRGDLVSAENPLITVLSGNRNLILFTEENESELSVSSANGTVAVVSGGRALTPKIVGSKQTFQIPTGDFVTITAHAYDGYLFKSWKGDLVSTLNPLVTRITENTDFVMETEGATIPLIVECTNGAATVKSGGTEIRPVSAGGHTVYNVPKNSYITARAEPDNGYSFRRWTGDTSSSENPHTFRIREPKSIVAEMRYALSNENEIYLTTVSGHVINDKQQIINPEGRALDVWDYIASTYGGSGTINTGQELMLAGRHDEITSSYHYHRSMGPPASLWLLDDAAFAETIIHDTQTDGEIKTFSATGAEVKLRDFEELNDSTVKMEKRERKYGIWLETRYCVDNGGFSGWDNDVWTRISDAAPNFKYVENIQHVTRAQALQVDWVKVSIPASAAASSVTVSAASGYTVANDQITFEFDNHILKIEDTLNVGTVMLTSEQGVSKTHEIRIKP